MVVNLSYNDRDAEEFDRNMRTLVELNESLGTETLFVLEAASLEKRDIAGLKQRHDVLRAVASSADLSVLDLYAYMNDSAIYDSGFLWWDQVHMTSYAQDLAATWLAEQIRPHLPAP